MEDWIVAIKKRILSVEPNLPDDDWKRLESYYLASRRRRRFYPLLLSVVSAAAVLILFFLTTGALSVCRFSSAGSSSCFCFSASSCCLCFSVSSCCLCFFASSSCLCFSANSCCFRFSASGYNSPYSHTYCYNRWSYSVRSAGSERKLSGPLR